MSKPKKNPETKEVDAANSKIEAIKNLIFGENIAEYNQEFETLKQDLATRRQELLDYIDNTRKELMTAVDSLSTDINIRISDLEESLRDKTDDLREKKVDKTVLGDLLVKLGTTLKEK